MLVVSWQLYTVQGMATQLYDLILINNVELRIIVKNTTVAVPLLCFLIFAK